MSILKKVIFTSLFLSALLLVGCSSESQQQAEYENTPKNEEVAQIIQTFEENTDSDQYKDLPYIGDWAISRLETEEIDLEITEKDIIRISQSGNVENELSDRTVNGILIPGEEISSVDVDGEQVDLGGSYIRFSIKYVYEDNISEIKYFYDKTYDTIMLFTNEEVAYYSRTNS